MFRCFLPRKKTLPQKPKEKQLSRRKKRRIEEERYMKDTADRVDARQKQIEALVQEGEVLALKYHINSARVYGDLHPLDKKAYAKEQRIRNESIEVPNAGPEPDIPFEFRRRPPVKSLSSLVRRNSR